MKQDTWRGGCQDLVRAVLSYGDFLHISQHLVAGLSSNLTCFLLPDPLTLHCTLAVTSSNIEQLANFAPLVTKATIVRLSTYKNCFLT